MRMLQQCRPLHPQGPSQHPASWLDWYRARLTAVLTLLNHQPLYQYLYFLIAVESGWWIREIFMDTNSYKSRR